MFVVLQMKDRGRQEPRKKLTDEERAAKIEDYKRFMSGARAVVEQSSRQEIENAMQRVGDFMDETFKDYIPLRHHQFNFERRNIMKQYSKITPAEELSKYNLYTGGQGQTEEKFLEMQERKASSAAAKVEILSEEDI